MSRRMALFGATADILSPYPLPIPDLVTGGVGTAVVFNDQVLIANISNTDIQRYTSDLVSSVISPGLYRQIDSFSGAANYHHAGFTGGHYSSGGNQYIDRMVFLDTGFVRTTPTGGKYNDAAAVANGQYLMYGGGRSYSTTVFAYDETLTKTVCTSLSRGAESGAATFNGTHAIFGGGRYDASGMTPNVDAYDADLVKTTLANLSPGRMQLTAFCVNGYTCFAGGADGVTSSRPAYTTIDVYDKTLAKLTSIDMSVVRKLTGVAVSSICAILAGGMTKSVDNDYVATDVIDFVSNDLVVTSDTLSVPRGTTATYPHTVMAATVGRKCLFFGGFNSSATLTSVEGFKY